MSWSSISVPAAGREGRTGRGLGEGQGGEGSPASPEQIAAIKPGMNVLASCGTKVGVVDHLDGDTIKLALRDSLDGLHHYVPTSWVKKVHEDHVHLAKNSEETKAGWKPSAAACANCA